MKKKKKKWGETAKNSSEWSKPSSGLGRGKGQQSLETFAADVSLLTDLCCSWQMNYSSMLFQFGKKTPPTSVVFSNIDIFEQAIQISLHMTIHTFHGTKKRNQMPDVFWILSSYTLYCDKLQSHLHRDWVISGHLKDTALIKNIFKSCFYQRRD